MAEAEYAWAQQVSKSQGRTFSGMGRWMLLRYNAGEDRLMRFPVGVATLDRISFGKGVKKKRGHRSSARTNSTLPRKIYLSPPEYAWALHSADAVGTTFSGLTRLLFRRFDPSSGQLMTALRQFPHSQDE